MQAAPTTGRELSFADYIDTYGTCKFKGVVAGVLHLFSAVRSACALCESLLIARS